MFRVSDKHCPAALIQFGACRKIRSDIGAYAERLENVFSALVLQSAREFTAVYSTGQTQQKEFILLHALVIITKNKLILTMDNQQLQSELKDLIISSLNLEDVRPEDIDPKEPLFNDGLGLDSIDALELGLALKKKYNINISADDKDNKKYFASLEALADFIAKQKA